MAIAALALLPALLCGALQLQRRPEPLAAGEVRPAEARAWGASALFVDARTRGRYDAGHIPGAQLLNEDEWPTLVPLFLDAWEPGQRIVVYCDGGGCEASHRVADRLRGEMNLPEVFVLKGGWPAWQHE